MLRQLPMRKWMRKTSNDSDELKMLQQENLMECSWITQDIFDISSSSLNLCSSNDLQSHMEFIMRNEILHFKSTFLPFIVKGNRDALSSPRGDYKSFIVHSSSTSRSLDTCPSPFISTSEASENARRYAFNRRPFIWSASYANCSTRAALKPQAASRKLQLTTNVTYIVCVCNTLRRNQFAVIHSYRPQPYNTNKCGQCNAITIAYTHIQHHFIIRIVSFPLVSRMAVALAVTPMCAAPASTTPLHTYTHTVTLIILRRSGFAACIHSAAAIAAALKWNENTTHIERERLSRARSYTYSRLDIYLAIVILRCCARSCLYVFLYAKSRASSR